MAIAYHLPLSQWYFDTTSMWTLDYPPLFAWFEFCLAHLASLVELRILVLSSEPVVLGSVRYFQRASVMLSDLALLAAAWSFVQTIPNAEAAPTTTRHAPPSTPRAINVRPSLLPAHAPSSFTAAAASAAAHSSWRVELRHWAVLLPLVFSAGLFIVDHVHFQYNGMLLALLIYACSLVRQGRNLAAGVAFATLLNAKHLFLYLAPAFTVYLWRHYCNDVRYAATALSECSSRRAETLGETSSGEQAPRVDDSDDHHCHAGSFRPLRLVALGACVAGVFTLSLGPLLAVGGLPQLAQLKERLFPFGRGLLHAYWAPNVWALYAAADRALVFAQSRPALSFLFPASFARASAATGAAAALPSVTRGLVGGTDTAFAILPTPSPPVVSLLVLLAMLPALRALWRHPHPRVLLAALVQSALAGFMLGWHVHEKAALVHCALLGLTAIDSVRDARAFEAAALIAHTTLLPLLFGAAERPIKLLLCAAYALGVSVLLDASSAADLKRRRIDAPPPPPLIVRAYLWAGAPLAAALAEWVLPLALPQLPFLPLILLSVYGAVGNLYVCALAWQLMQRLEQQLQSA